MELGSRMGLVEKAGLWAEPRRGEGRDEPDIASGTDGESGLSGEIGGLALWPTGCGPSRYASTERGRLRLRLGSALPSPALSPALSLLRTLKPVFARI